MRPPLRRRPRRPSRARRMRLTSYPKLAVPCRSAEILEFCLRRHPGKRPVYRKYILSNNIANYYINLIIIFLFTLFLNKIRTFLIHKIYK